MTVVRVGIASGGLGLMFGLLVGAGASPWFLVVALGLICGLISLHFPGGRA